MVGRVACRVDEDRMGGSDHREVDKWLGVLE